MVYRLGRFLQLLGLLVLPVGVAGNIANPEMVGVRASLGIAATGIAVFALGWALQHLAH